MCFVGCPAACLYALAVEQKSQCRGGEYLAERGNYLMGLAWAWAELRRGRLAVCSGVVASLPRVALLHPGQG